MNHPYKENILNSRKIMTNESTKVIRIASDMPIYIRENLSENVVKYQ